MPPKKALVQRVESLSDTDRRALQITVKLLKTSAFSFDPPNQSQDSLFKIIWKFFNILRKDLR